MRKYFLLFLILIAVFGFTNSASAQDYLPIVPCGEADNPCTTCHIFQLIKNVIDFIAFSFTPVVGALMFVITGFRLILSRGNPGAVAQVTKTFFNIVIAIAIIYGAWLVTNFTMRTLAGDSNIATEWYKLECEGVAGGGGQQDGTNGGSTNGGSDNGGGLPTNGGGSDNGGSGDGGSPTEDPALTENGARKILNDNGIPVNKGACPFGVPYQEVAGGCTSLDGVKQSTIDGAIRLKEECDCEVIVTGGTELGHAAAPVGSHQSGDKLDFGRNPELDAYIRNNYTFIGRRSDGARLYRDQSGAIYAEEHDHWDVKGWDVDYSG